VKRFFCFQYCLSGFSEAYDPFMNTSEF
jgi:hypothetical protein